MKIRQRGDIFIGNVKINGVLKLIISENEADIWEEVFKLLKIGME